MKKRIIAMFLAATMAFSLAACGSGNGERGERTGIQQQRRGIQRQ